VKQPLIVIFSIIAGYVFATFLSVGLLVVGIDIPAMFANSGSQYDTYGGVEILLMTIGLSWAMYRVLARRFLENKASEPTLTVSSPVATAVERQPQAPLADTPSLAQPESIAPTSPRSFATARRPVTPSPAQPEFIAPVSSPVATAVESHTPASANAQPMAVPGQKQWARRTPWLLAAGVALAWAILSVGPTRLASDIGALQPRDTVTAPVCDYGKLIGGLCVYYDSGSVIVIDGMSSRAPSTQYSVPMCLAPAALGIGDMCHQHFDADPKPLVNDVLLGVQNGLLAFLAIGAALLLWLSLRAALLLQNAPVQPAAQPKPAAPAPIDPLEQVRKLAALRDDGILTNAEFETKKAELLDRL
jgi:hypothetical protein